MGKKNYEVERPTRDDDEIANGYLELQRSKDYSDEKLYPMHRIEALGFFWMEEETNPLRSPRGQEEARQITKLLTFEAAYRQGRIGELTAFYNKKNDA